MSKETEKSAVAEARAAWELERAAEEAGQALRQRQAELEESELSGDPLLTRLQEESERASLRLEHALAALGGHPLRLPSAGYEWLEEQMARLAARAEKLGIAPPVLTLLGREWERSTGGPVSEAVELCWARVSGLSPVLEGHRLEARILRRADGVRVERLPNWRAGERESWQDLGVHVHDPNHCDHCGFRRARHDTFLVRREADRQLLQVGSSCLKDLLGHRSITELVRLAEGMQELSRLSHSKGWSASAPWGVLPRRVPLDDLLACVGRIVSEEGSFVTRKQASVGGVPSTAQLAEQRYRELAAGEFRAEPTPDEKLHALEIIDFLRLGEHSGFAAKLASAASNDYLAPNQVALVCYAHQLYADSRDAGGSGSHQGRVGERLQLKLRVSSASHTPASAPYWREKSTLTFRDGEGNRFTWFASSKPELEAGVEYQLLATVDRHGEYAGEPVTYLKRVRALASPADPPLA